MKNRSVFSLAVLCGAAVVVWQLLPVLTARAENDMRVQHPAGFTPTPVPVGPQGMASLRQVTLLRVVVEPGAKWTNVAPPRANTWWFCYELSGVMSMKRSDGTTSTIRPDTPFTFAPTDKPIPLFANQGKQPARYICWEFVSR